MCCAGGVALGLGLGPGRGCCRGVGLVWGWGRIWLVSTRCGGTSGRVDFLD